MSAYNAALFVHILGVVALFMAIGIQQWAGAQVRAAGTLEHLRLWLGVVRRSQNLYPPAVVLILLGGLFMAGTAWTFTTPWIVVGLIGLAAMVILGIVVVGRGFTAMETAVSSAGAGPVPADVARIVARPGAWACLYALNGTAIGILWLMTNKPGWIGSIAVVAVVAAVAGVAGGAAAGQKRQRSVERLAGGRQ